MRMMYIIDKLTSPWFIFVFDSCFLTLQGANKWYELQDLHVKDILPPVITLSESYIQVIIRGRDLIQRTQDMQLVFV